MGFFTGRLSFTRFRIDGPSPGMFGPEHLERLAEHLIGKNRFSSSDGVDVGWIAGDHILDTNFDLAKNIVNDTLNFCIRLDANKIPTELFKAYAALELKALAAGNPSGLPSTKQKREAKETARARIEDESKDGRFLKRKSYPILWDAVSNELLVGTNSASVVDRIAPLFEKTFGYAIEPLSAGSQGFRLAESRNQTRGIDDAMPSAFVPGVTPEMMAWLPDEANRDFLGNEFFLWLWYYLENEDDTLKLPDGSEAVAMLTSTLVLECPRGQTGKESITHEGPTRLPEARRAIQSGKLPRKVGLTVVRHESPYELSLSAETFAITGAKLPAAEASEERARLEERVTQIRHLLETLDLMYDTFGQRRASDDWAGELAKMQRWLAREERKAA